MILSDEADFYFNGYINKQNYHHWFATTPREKLTYSRKLSTPKSREVSLPQILTLIKKTITISINSQQYMYFNRPQLRRTNGLF